MSTRQSKRKEETTKEEKENEEAEMKKEKKKVSIWDLNRLIAAEARAWEKFISYQASPFL